MGFQVIHVAPDLDARDRRRARRSGPWAVAARYEPSELMRRAGLRNVTAIDQTERFRSTAAAWIEEWDQHRELLVALYGQSDYDARQQDRRTQLRGIDDGLLKRSLVLGRA